MAENEAEQSKAGEDEKHLLAIARKVSLLSLVIRTFTSIAKESLGFSYWADLGPGLHPEYQDEQPEKTRKKSRRDQAPTFDASTFKSQYEFRFPARAIQVALWPPEWRSEEDVKLLRSTLRGMPSFRRYSQHMQFMLARVVRYERFGRGRVIVRKGHCGNSFYFVFSGQIAVTQDQDGSSAFLDPEPILMRKGASFGEVALLKGLRRNATIVCMEETELLVVDKEDFFSHQLDQKLHSEFLHRYSFFRSLSLFSSWSDKNLEMLADHCKAEEFNHGQIIVKDSSETRNIVFVTKGRCDVLRLVNLSKCPSYHKWIRLQEMVLGKSLRWRSLENGKKDGPDLRGVTGSPLRHISYQQMAAHPNATGHKSHIPGSRQLTPRMPFQSSGSTVTQCHPSVPRLSISNTEGMTEHKESIRALDLYHTPSSQRELSKATSSAAEGELPDNMKAAVYLRVDVLRPGQYFRALDLDYVESCLEKDGRHPSQQGLGWAMPPQHTDSRAMVIISQGCEIIRVKLEKFCEMVDTETLENLRAGSQPYPSDDKLCQVFLEQNRWKVFKGDLLTAVKRVGCGGRLPQINLNSGLTSRRGERNNAWDINHRGVLYLTQSGQNKEQIWAVSSSCDSTASSTEKDEETEAFSRKETIRLIHSIALPKLYGHTRIY
ncbi:cyclic nucleotide-binding domain-containing protein 2-like isoform X2 [Erpetoichthys calabaricus]|uniref:cyclic nucleotide-binding domain-containing protein 2-like isoform X2 n=1 Tax=Erpetoichthys calabaricus TaxID=27687 RepID=UPI00223411FB|nr:cyclic nucleotide-binding domain-containing protein 2-like isoform X2 [Erpetoichthys calabaricus]